jgi:hypothetical protein
MRDWPLFVHIAAAMTWAGGLLIFAVLAAGVLEGGEPDALARFVRSPRVIGLVVLGPASVLVIRFGI